MRFNKMLYPIAIEVGDQNTSYGVIVPDILGCYSAGDSLEEAIENTREAITVHLETLVDMNVDIPLPKAVDSNLNNDEYRGMLWALVDVDVSKYLGKTEKVNVTLPSRLIHMIDEKVASDKSRYKSRSGYLASLAEQALIKN